MSKPSNLHFVLNDTDRWQDLLSGDLPTPADIKNRIITGEDIWVLLTYLHFRNAGYKVTLGSGACLDKINVIDGVKSRPKNTFADYFYVACRTDAHYPEFGHFVLHQNLIHTGKSNEIYVPQWPQPGLVLRESQRGNSIKTVAFFGQPKRNLGKAFQSEAFLSELKKRGIEFIIKGKSNDSVEWHDYSNVDIVIAVRDVPVELLKIKPVNKATNAWLAGALCITGDEPAITAAFNSNKAVLHATTVNGVLAIIDRLREHPELFSELATEGQKLAQDYSEPSVLSYWVRMEEFVTPEFERWKKTGKAERLINYSRRRILNRFSKSTHKWTISRHI
ncbi:hypothetical protein [Endozoicomonas sp. YOMI1]|uniref:hypothetical protein n=1 Tax=Endozoicomonas sp. YOMI1 TaxID=2828739 RepID=UPI002147FD35|nr:hypothetical protein [Endozoicomonas sp. YOMI1]